jgi:Na+/melibiose symporter-like transporter
MGQVNQQQKTKKQATWWLCLARVLPLVALGVIIVPLLVGDDTWFQVAMCAVIIVFSTLAILWWYWAVERVVTMWDKQKQVEETSINMLAQLKHIRNLLDEIRKTK